MMPFRWNPVVATLLVCVLSSLLFPLPLASIAVETQTRVALWGTYLDFSVMLLYFFLYIQTPGAVMAPIVVQLLSCTFATTKLTEVTWNWHFSLIVDTATQTFDLLWDTSTQTLSLDSTRLQSTKTCLHISKYFSTKFSEFKRDLKRNSSLVWELISFTRTIKQNHIWPNFPTYSNMP